MKKLIIFFPILFIILGFTSCGEELDSKSIFDDDVIKYQNDFDRWLDRYYLKPYNIEVIYQYVDVESSYDYDLIPADFDKSKTLTYMIKYLWIEPYEEVVGVDFIRHNALRVLNYVGNPGWKSNNSFVTGLAGGGIKVTLLNVNSIVINNPTTYMSFIKTIHHEYAHIFQQKKATDPAFDLLSKGDYLSDNWTSRNQTDALRLGFVSPYAGSDPTEDFVEIYSIYVTNTPAYWDQLLITASTDAAGQPAKGADIIRKKFQIVYDYYKNEWGVDMSKMRDVVNRRKQEVMTLNFEDIYK